jgi:hypothetical protein
MQAFQGERCLPDSPLPRIATLEGGRRRVWTISSNMASRPWNILGTPGRREKSPELKGMSWEGFEL